MRGLNVILTGLVLVTGPGSAEDEPAPVVGESSEQAVADPGAISLAGVVETREGTKREGAVSIVDGVIRITPGGSDPSAIPLGDIVRLTVERQTSGEPLPSGTQALSLIHI